MDENRRPRPARVRRGSSPEVTARLQRSRRRALDRRAAQREREKIVTAAVRDYINAWHAIGLVQQRRDSDIDDLNRQIQYVITHAEDEIAGRQQEQVTAAAVIHEQGHTDNEIADLLEISTKHARQLISTSRRTKGVKPGSARPLGADPDRGKVHTPSGSESQNSVPLRQTGRTIDRGPASTDDNDVNQ